MPCWVHGPGDGTGWASPSSVLPQLVPKLSRNYLKEGYMEKTGPKVGAKQQASEACLRSAILLLSVWGCLGSAWVAG